MLISIAAGVKAQLTLTVADGAATNSHLPVYGYYTDAYLQADFVCPATDLVEMTGGVINSMTFYSSTSSATWGIANFVVSVKEIDATSLTGFATTDGFTEVYSGSLSIANSQMTVNFTTPYLYTGRNLLIRVQNTIIGSYVSCTWLGCNATNCSYSGYSSTSLNEITATSRGFLPKVTFGHAAGDPNYCFPVKNLMVTNTTSEELSVSWTSGGSETAWAVSTDSGETWDNATDTFYTFYNLNSNTFYTVSVRSLCNSGDSSLVRAISSRTACSGYTDVPYCTGFENFSNNEVPHCWQQILTGVSSSGTFPSVYNGGTIVDSTVITTTTYTYNTLNLTALFGNACTAPSNITVRNTMVDGVTLSWTAEAGQAAWQIAIVSIGYNDTVETSTNPYTFTGLPNSPPKCVPSAVQPTATGAIPSTSAPLNVRYLRE